MKLNTTRNSLSKFRINLRRPLLLHICLSLYIYKHGMNGGFVVEELLNINMSSTRSLKTFLTYFSICTFLLFGVACCEDDDAGFRCMLPPPKGFPPVSPEDFPLVQFPLNLEHLEADFFLYSATGEGLDKWAPYLVDGGPPPIGPCKANLDPYTRDVIYQFGLQEIGHLRAIKEVVGPFPRPLLDLSKENFATLMDLALGHKLDPPFDPYANTINYLLASYVIPYVGLNGYVGINPNLIGFYSKRLVAGLLGVEAGQDAIIRDLLYQKAEELVEPYDITVGKFTDKISILRNELGHCGIKDEGLIVPLYLGAENKTHGNILSADPNSLSYPRTPAEILSVVYATGDEHKPGGFFPKGGNGKIARYYLEEK